jgi:serine/threonine protein kinase
MVYYRGVNGDDDEELDPLLSAVAATPRLRVPSTPTAGEVIGGRFVIEGLERSGGMGRIFRATDQLTGAPVALKVLGQERSASTSRFAREARILAELTHPAVVRYLAQGETTDGNPFLVMEWLEGQDVSDRLDGGGLTVGESLALAWHAADGLAAAHARGVVHRDVKPSNLFLVQKDASRVKVLDFGIARYEEADAPRSVRAVTRPGEVVGTAGYMSPEQASGKRDVDARTDVFSLGCVLYECLAGQPAFAADHMIGVVAKLLYQDAAPLRFLRPDLPVALDQLLSRMLARDRALRPEDAGSLARALAEFQKLSGPAPERKSGPSGSDSTTKNEGRRPSRQ